MAYSQTPTLFNSKFHKSQNFKLLKIQVKIPLPHFTNKKFFPRHKIRETDYTLGICEALHIPQDLALEECWRLCCDKNGTGL